MIEENEAQLTKADEDYQLEQSKMEAEKAYRSIARLISQCENIDDMVRMMTNQQIIFCGAMAFAVAHPKMTTKRAKANYMLRKMYNNAKTSLEGMSESELDFVSMEKQFTRGDS